MSLVKRYWKELTARGLVAPGHNYLGPFNAKDRGEPTTKADKLAQQHDDDVEKYGWRSYFFYQKADDDFLKDIVPEDEWEQFAKDWYTYKKREWPHFSKQEEQRIAKDMTKATDKQRKKDKTWFDVKKGTAAKEAMAAAEAKKKGNPSIGPVMTPVQPSQKKRKSNGEATSVQREIVIDTDGDMDVEMGDNTGMLLRSGGDGGSTGRGNRETPVIEYPPTLRFFTETHTQVCPVEMYFSANNLGNASSTKNSWFVRMNSWFGMFDGQTAPNGTTQVVATTQETGMSRSMTVDGNTMGTNTIQQFPRVLSVASGSSPTAVFAAPVPKWTKMFDKIYDNYTIIETQWKLTMMNPNTNSEKNVVVVWDYDTYGTSSTGNVMPAASLATMLEWDNVNVETLGTSNTEGERNIKTISGVWRPGEQAHNVFNDKDLTTWTTTGVPPDPIYFENLQFRFFKDELAEGGGTAFGTSINCKLELTYIVQYKDLKVNLRYPVSGQTPITWSLPGDMLQA